MAIGVARAAFANTAATSSWGRALSTEGAPSRAVGVVESSVNNSMLRYGFVCSSSGPTIASNWVRSPSATLIARAVVASGDSI